MASGVIFLLGSSTLPASLTVMDEITLRLSRGSQYVLVYYIHSCGQTIFRSWPAGAHLRSQAFPPFAPVLINTRVLLSRQDRFFKGLAPRGHESVPHEMNVEVWASDFVPKKCPFPKAPPFKVTCFKPKNRSRSSGSSILIVPILGSMNLPDRLMVGRRPTHD